MRPGFKLNCHNREINPLFESHDPSIMYDAASGMYYSYATDSAITSNYRQGIPIRRSRNLVDFEFVGYALSDAAIKQGRDNGQYPSTRGFWAPFVEYSQGEYRMYYSATRAFGSSESRIWLAVANNPEGPFENRGVVVDSWGTDDSLPNAIDPHIIDDEKGNKYLVYGSFFGGIYLKELEVTTGLSLDHNPHILGERIAHKPENSYIDGPEGASIIRNHSNGKYYLFLSYGWLGEDYDIRVGVSDTVRGPYRDMAGASLDGESLGIKLAGSYWFTASKPYAEEGDGWSFGGFRGPGHGVPFFNEPEGEYYFVHHIRDGAKSLMKETDRQDGKVSYLMHYMMVRRMYFLNDIPVFSPEPFAGEEPAQTECFKLDIVDGVPHFPEEIAQDTDILHEDYWWEWIIFSNDDNHMTRAKHEGVQIQNALVVAGVGYDYENSGVCVTICGYTQDGRTIWGKGLKNNA
ncbi:MAG: arabinan endo-1,5-alpha-L-arabinosidase [Clostridiales bacterium]|nr:arabinan endo-1,5-alpha-L-arabinosidase [Clostridiales bacterium]